MAEMTWDDAYRSYRNQLLAGDVNADFIRSTYEPLSKDFADRIVAIHNDLTNQQKASVGDGKTLGDQWWGGDIGKDDATWDMAFRLAETGVGSLYDIGQRQVEREVEGYNGPEMVTDFELFNKRTGDALTNFNRESGTFDTTYNLQFAPNGMPIAYTGNKKSGWVEFRDDFLKPAAMLAGSFIPGVGPYLAAANAAYSASKGDWGKAILSALPAVGNFAGQIGVAADTVSSINEANKYAKILKTIEDKNLLGLAFQGADLAGIKELGNFDLNDVKKAVNLGMAIKNEDPIALARAGMAYAPRGTKGAGDAGYKPTTDFSFKADYSLFPDSDYQGLGLKVPTDFPDVLNPDGSVNYELFDFNQFGQPIGLKMPKSPNIGSMGGGQGLRLPVDGGYITEAGFIPHGYTPDLGDPSSFINQPPPGGDVSAEVQKATTPSSKQPSNSGVEQGPIPLTVPDNAADIKLMEDIFGTSLSAPSTGNETDKAEALARLLRS